MPGSIKARGSHASRSIVQWNLPFTIWREKPAPANPIETPAQAPASGASPAPAVSPGPATAAGTPKPTSVRVRVPRIGINRLQPGIQRRIPGTQPGPGATPAASPSGQPPVSPMPEQKPPALPFLSPERRRHDLLRMNPTEIPLKSPGSVTDLSIGEVEQVKRALIDASTRVPV